MTCAGEPLAPAGGCGASVVSGGAGAGRFPDSLSPMPARSGSPSSARLLSGHCWAAAACSAGPPQPCQVHPHWGRGRRGGQEPKPTPGKNLELGGDPSFSQAPTKDAACRSGGQRGPWGAAGGSTLGAGLMDSACLCREMTGLRAWVKQVKNPNICISCGFAPFKVKLLGAGDRAAPKAPVRAGGLGPCLASPRDSDVCVVRT